MGNWELAVGKIRFLIDQGENLGRQKAASSRQMAEEKESSLPFPSSLLSPVPSAFFP